MKKNPPDDKFGFIKVMLSWQEPCFQLPLNSPYFITDIFLWPSKWVKYEMKKAEKEEWLSVSLCNLSSAASSPYSDCQKNQENLQTRRAKTPNNNLSYRHWNDSFYKNWDRKQKCLGEIWGTDSFLLAFTIYYLITMKRTEHSKAAAWWIFFNLLQRFQLKILLPSSLHENFLWRSRTWTPAMAN